MGKVVDAETGSPINNAVITDWGRPNNNVSTDQNGAFTLTIDSLDSPVNVEADNYGQMVGAAAMLNGDVQLYKTGSDLSIMVSATITNHARILPGTLLTAAAIILFFKIFKLI